MIDELVTIPEGLDPELLEELDWAVEEVGTEGFEELAPKLKGLDPEMLDELRPTLEEDVAATVEELAPRLEKLDPMLDEVNPEMLNELDPVLEELSIGMIDDVTPVIESGFEVLNELDPELLKAPEAVLSTLDPTLRGPKAGIGDEVNVEINELYAVLENIDPTFEELNPDTLNEPDPVFDELDPDMVDETDPMLEEVDTWMSNGLVMRLNEFASRLDTLDPRFNEPASGLDEIDPGFEVLDIEVLVEMDPTPEGLDVGKLNDVTPVLDGLNPKLEKLGIEILDKLDSDTLAEPDEEVLVGLDMVANKMEAETWDESLLLELPTEIDETIDREIRMLLLPDKKSFEEATIVGVSTTSVNGSPDIAGERVIVVGVVPEYPLLIVTVDIERSTSEDETGKELLRLKTSDKPAMEKDVETKWLLIPNADEESDASTVDIESNA